MQSHHSNLMKLGEQRLAELLNTHNVPLPKSHQDLTFLLGHSDFIYRQCQRYFLIFKHLSDTTTSAVNKVTLEIPSWPYLHDDWIKQSETEALQSLRQHRHHLMVVIAAQHFLNHIDIKTSMRYLSESADLFYTLAREWAVEHLAPRCGYALNSDGQPVPLIALGMGKLGGYELNFSSDIDLIFCFSEKGTTSKGRKQEDFQSYFNRLAQKVIHLLDTVTPDGQVFRVDMRLRPFGDSGPLVSSFASLEDYYQDQGREWERYALLKARPLSHEQLTSPVEILQHYKLLELLKPFVYRRYIDFSVIESLRKMKQQIASEVARRNLINNIKLGQGGIREAEFIVQALQMLRGGKEPQLQQPSFLVVLPELSQLKVFSTAEAKSINDSYLWLRHCEQYLQAFDDQQTQTLPSDELNQQRLLSLFKMKDWSELVNQVNTVTKVIHTIFDELIGEDPQATQHKKDPNLDYWKAQWLTGPQSEKSDEQTQMPQNHLPLRQCLLDNRADLIKSVLSSRGRDRLDLLMPHLLAECSKQGISEEQCNDILKIIRRISTRTTYLALLVEHPGALTQLVKLVASCHFIGQELKNFPLLLDQLIDPKLLYSVPNINDYHSDLRRNLLRVSPDDLELQMEILRQFKLSSQLIIAACDVTNVIDLAQVSDHLTAMSEAILQQVVNLAWRQMVERYGYPDGATEEDKNFAVIGYGKLGGYELGYGSDLDVVFVHGCKSSKATSGKKAIDSRQFYLKLAQRVLHFFTTRTPSGILYELDTRLRPSGESGLMAINIETFGDYQHKEAWTWEHQAIVRARVVLGSEKLTQRFNEIRSHIIRMEREPKSLIKDISEMRRKMHDNLSKSNNEVFDLKQSRGGIADIEFITQYLVLQYSHKYVSLAEYSDNRRLLEQFAELKLISHEQANKLWLAYENYREWYHQASLNLRAKNVARDQVEQQSNFVKSLWKSLGLS